jgi:hypothetical protein
MRGRDRGGCAGALRWRETREPAMNPLTGRQPRFERQIETMIQTLLKNAPM